MIKLFYYKIILRHNFFTWKVLKKYYKKSRDSVNTVLTFDWDWAHKR